MPPRVLVLGGGFSAVGVCRSLKKDIAKGRLDVTVVSRENSLCVHGLIPEMITGRVSVELLSGPISIARFAYLFALIDSWEFVFFLGMISINLAVINFLPIPVLDGGHMVFLIYEKLRGKPASEGVRVGATYAGLAFILCLMVFVFYLDITRIFRSN